MVDKLLAIFLFCAYVTRAKSSFSYQAQIDDHSSGNYPGFVVRAPNVTIPDSMTTYWCSIVLLPDFANRVHGVGFEGAISPQSYGLVHHIMIFGCDVNDGVIPAYNGICGARNRPQELSRCANLLGAWASGAKTFFYPKNAGLTFYSPSKSQYVMMEIHYNNMAGVGGVIDDSGVRFLYTNHRLPNEVGVLEVGVIYSDDMIIPPHQKKFLWTGICPSRCTKTALPREGIHVFGSQLHAHLSGTKIWTSHFRNNLKLPEVDRDNNYSTWIETINPLSPFVNVLPGDTLTTTCEFNTKSRSNITFGGLGILDEMCITYLHYYPKANLEVCKSKVSRQSLDAFFTVESLTQGRFVTDYKDVDWNPSSIRRLQLMYDMAPSEIHCMKSDGTSWDDHSNNTNPRILPRNLESMYN